MEKKDMHENFDMIMPRLFDSFDYLDMERVKRVLAGIDRNCLCVGTGGSNSVSLFASIVLSEINGILTVSKELRDVLLADSEIGVSVIFCHGIEVGVIIIIFIDHRRRSVQQIIGNRQFRAAAGGIGLNGGFIEYAD